MMCEMMFGSFGGGLDARREPLILQGGSMETALQGDCLRKGVGGLA